jgi:phage terminase large subunit GpA-like protein
MSVAQWAEEKRHLSEKNSAFPGRFSFAMLPFLREPLDCLSDRRVREVDAQKSAQIGWSDGVLCNWLGYIASENPASTMVLFPADKKGKEFGREKFDPMVDATAYLQPVLTTRSRAKESTQDYKDFPGGFIKFVGSNSPSNVKSTSAKNLAVEEPDDCNLNIKGQGDSITLLEERGKTFPDKKLLVGGTPTIKGVSAIEARMKTSDQRHWHVPCHACGEAAPLSWDNVRCTRDPGRNHEVYGDAVPESTRYACPACGVLWTDGEKNANARRGRWVAAGEFRGVAGFYFNELMSPFADSSLERLMEKYLRAKHALESEGDVTKMIAFWNASLGLSYEYKGTTGEAKDYEARTEDYPEWFVPWGGLVLTVGVDVQHGRLAVSVKAWGEGEESWLVYAGEIPGNVLEQEVWDELDRTVVFRAYRHVSGADLAISAVSVDTSDGQTADAGYAYVRRANRRFGKERVMAIKGATTESSEIFRAPSKPLDVTATHKAAKYGLRPYIVGVSRAKDLILGAEENAGRINLRDADGKTGHGPGRLHWYRGVREDYFEQLTSEVKAPARSIAKRGGRMRKVWQKKAGKRNEFLDCEVYALHAARALRLDTYTAPRWADLRRSIMQNNLFAPKAEVPAELEVQEAGESPGVGGDGRSSSPVSSSGAPATSPAPLVPPAAPRPRPGARRMRSSGIQL